MRKTLIAFLMLFSLTPLFAFSFGYGIGSSGQAGAYESSSFEMMVSLDFTKARYVTLDGELRVGSAGGKVGLNGLSATLSADLFKTTHHPFGFMFSNTMNWSLRAAFGVNLNRAYELEYIIRVSPVRLEDVHFCYDFLAPYFYFDSSFAYSGWGISLIKVAYYF